MSESTRKVLEQRLPEIRQKLERLQRRKDRIGEQNTKAALIDPLLDALGWDITDPDEVHREYKSKPQDSPVDYALLLLRSPRLFLEAKALEKDLKDRRWISQVLGYATVVGVEWCVLTNGDEYRIYNAHAPVDVEEKLFRAVKVSDQDGTDFTIETLALLSKDKLEENLLEVLWKAHFVDRNVKEALEKLIQDEDRGLIRLLRKKTTKLQPAEIRDSLRRADIRIEFPVAPEQVPPPQAKKPEREKPERAPKKAGVVFHGVKVLDLIQAGLIDPPLPLRRAYKSVDLTAEIQVDGRVTFQGVAYKSPSLAAGMARKTVIGVPPGKKYPSTNGWTFWQYYDSGTERLEELDWLRQQYLKQAGRSPAGAGSELDEYDTIVVPAKEEGFRRRFLGENCWFAIRMSRVKMGRVRYIAAYQTEPLSAITHYAEVDRIERYQDTKKYIVYFKGPAREIGPIPLPEGEMGLVIQSPRYTSFKRLSQAKTLADIF